MFTLMNENFIQMIKSFYPNAKVGSGGAEVIVRCNKCGDSRDPKHAHMYIKVPQASDEVPLYHCKKCNAKGVVDDIFLRSLGCDDSRVLIEMVKHINDLKKTPKYNMLKAMDIYPLRNTFISDKPWNEYKRKYINERIGSNFTYEEIIGLKIFLNLYDVLNLNRLNGTRDKRVTDALNEHFVGFISYDNSYCIMRKCTDAELYKGINKRYINYNLVNKFDDSKDYYIIPTKINIEDRTPIKIHIAEGVFDILSIYYNLNKCNNYQNIYASASGKSYSQVLNFILGETGIINYEIHLYPDNDVDDSELNALIMKSIYMLPCNIIVHRNCYSGEKDYGVPANRIKDKYRVIYEKQM